MANFSYNPEQALQSFHPYAVGVSALFDHEEVSLVPARFKGDPKRELHAALTVIESSLIEVVHNLVEKGGRVSVREAVKRSFDTAHAYYSSETAYDVLGQPVYNLRPNPLGNIAVVAAILSNRFFRIGVPLLTGAVPCDPFYDEVIERHETRRKERIKNEQGQSTTINHLTIIG